MKQNYFLKNLVFFLIPLSFPILILGAFTILIFQGHIKSNLEKNSFNLLSQTKENVDLILKELDSLSLNFDKDPKIVKRLKGILAATSLSMEDINSLDFIKNFIETTHNSKSYIHSIYIYFERGGRTFLSSAQGLTDLDRCYDPSWFTYYFGMKRDHEFWSRKYRITQNDFDPRPVSILSLSKKLYSPGSGTGDGVLILNILPEYIETTLKNLATLPEQRILIFNESQKIIFQNIEAPGLADIDLIPLETHPHKLVTRTISGERYSLSSIYSDRYQWRYVSLVPYRILYRPLYRLIGLTIFLLLSSAGLGLLMAYSITRKNYRHLEQIFNLIDAAKSGAPLPAMPSRTRNEYEYILQNMLQAFIEQNYLQIQLSKRKYKLQLMEFKALQAQINPHFLYNTLHSIYWEVLNISGKPTKANLMLSSLTDILKYSLSPSDHPVTLAEEIRYTRSYIQIQQLHYPKGFDCLWEYDEADLKRPIIKLILQPLVENSIRHGITSLPPGGGAIKIKIRRCGAALNLSIIDNGVGIPPDKLRQIQERLAHNDNDLEHIGIFNVHKRLKLYYHQALGLKIYSKTGRGTVVRMTLPAIETNAPRQTPAPNDKINMP